MDWFLDLWSRPLMSWRLADALVFSLVCWLLALVVYGVGSFLVGRFRR